MYTVHVRIVIAPDKYKGSLTAVEASEAMARGVRAAFPDADVITCPMADGGEGTVEAIAAAIGADIRETEVRGPLEGQRARAKWAYASRGWSAREGEPPGASGPTAVIEMAQASGYSLVPRDRRNPMETSTYGTGELIRAALDEGCGRVIVGIGGSGTVDGGTGMAAALGYRFLDGAGRELPPKGGSLSLLRTIDCSGRDERLGAARFVVASDVNNPLTGPQGAARVFGPQKGATRAQVEELDAGLGNLGRLVCEQLGADVLELEGAGAAGGLGAGLVAFCGAEIESGVRLIAQVTGLEERVRGADLVLTGEGSYDGQTSRGKTPAGVAALAEAAGVPVVIVAGRVEAAGGVPAFCVVPGPMSLEEAMRNAGAFVADGTARLMGLLGVGGRLADLE